MLIQRTGFVLSLSLLGLAACGNEEDPPVATDYEKQSLLGVKAYITGELEDLEAAAVALKAAAPDADADGWNATSDTAAVNAMKAEWKKARIAYERVEGAIAVLFPNLDASTDERYDGFLEEGPDANLFDDEGVTGVHGIERILWADSHPPEVVTFESTLTGYTVAAFPATQQEADDFKNKLLEQLVVDAKKMKDDFAPLALDSATAYRGVVGSMEEQLEKVSLAQTGQSESRYAKHTLADMRANLEGGEATFTVFKPWIASKEGGAALITSVEASFAKIRAEYAMTSGDSIPDVPATWNPDEPSAADLMTPYGKLYTLLTTEADPATSTSLVSVMTDGASMLGIPTLPE